VAVLILLISSSVIFIVISPGERSRDPHRMSYFIAGRQIEALTKAVQRYRQDCGEYPSARKGLWSLVVKGGVRGWRGPYIKEVPLDPWHRPYVYLASVGSAAPEILSYGVDGRLAESSWMPTYPIEILCG
jgi:type II secretion system protein G